MSNNLLAKCYHKNKGILQKKLAKDIKIFLRKKKKSAVWLGTIQKSVRR